MRISVKKMSRGSILAYSLILLGIVLVASIGMMSASVVNFKSVSSSEKSTNAFQVADSGSQAILKMMKKTSESTIGNMIINDAGGSCSGNNDAVAQSSGSFLGGSYKVTFQSDNGSTLKCSDSVADVASVKSVGTYSNTVRAVQVAVAASTCDTPGQIVVVAKGDSESFSSSDFSKVKSFASDSMKVIVGYRCVYSGSMRLEGFSSNYLISDSYFSVLNDSPIICASGSNCVVNPGYKCNGGWAIYGRCAADNN